MSTTAEKLREMRRNAGKNHDRIIRAYYENANAQSRGKPCPHRVNGHIWVAQSDGSMLKCDLDI